MLGKKAVSLVTSVTLALGLMPLPAFADGAQGADRAASLAAAELQAQASGSWYDDAIDLPLGPAGVTREVNFGAVDDDSVYFKVTPSADGAYRFYTTGGNDTAGYLRADDGGSYEKLASNDDPYDTDGDDVDFSFAYQLESGKTYYLVVERYSGSGASTLHVDPAVALSDLSVRLKDGAMLMVGDEDQGDWEYVDDDDPGQGRYFYFSQRVVFDLLDVEAKFADGTSQEIASYRLLSRFDYDPSTWEAGSPSNTVTLDYMGVERQVSVPVGNVTDAFAAAAELSVGTTPGTGVASGSTAYFKFTPAADGLYGLSSVMGDDDDDPVGTLYGADGTRIAENDDGYGKGLDFLIDAELSAGETYYLGVTGAKADFQVAVERVTPSALKSHKVVVTLDEDESHKYTGEPVEPYVTSVTVDGMRLPRDYYSVSYKNNVKVGKSAAVVITGKLRFTGNFEQKFEIEGKTPTIKAKTTSKKVTRAAAKVKAQKISLGASVNSKGKLSYKVLKKSSNKVSFRNGTATLKKGAYKKGKYWVKVRVSAAANGGYSAGTKDFTITFNVK